MNLMLLLEGSFLEVIIFMHLSRWLMILLFFLVMTYLD